MKKLTLTIILILSNILLIAQCDETCLPEGITFETQAEIDNFQSNYLNCTEIEGNVLIKGDEITNLNGLNVLTAIGGRLRFYSCSVLASLTGLENITSIGGDLEVYVWPSSSSPLINLTGLDNLTSIGGALKIQNTDALISLTGLENVINIGEYIQIAVNDALINLSGLDNLTSIGEDIWIGENTALTSLTGLENLTTVGGPIEIYDNSALMSLTGIDNIEAGSISDYLYISYNSSLSTCEVESVCDYLAMPNSNVGIYDNASGCNSEQEVQDACDVIPVVDKVITKHELTISPNPVNDQAVLSLNFISSTSIEICIFNTTGICIKRWQFQNQQPGEKEFILDLIELSAGVYFCRVKIGNEMVTKKIIKVK
jgi:hypothetical protein